MKVLLPINVEFAPFDYERRRLEAAGVSFALCEPAVEAIVAAGADAEVMFNLNHPLPRHLLERLPALQLISFYGIGYDKIDVAAAAELGIIVTNSPHYGTEEVADHALALLMACYRRLLESDRAVRRGEWDYTVYRPRHSLRNQTVGVIGFGNIGRAFARRALALGSRVLYFDPYVPESPLAGTTPAALDDLMRESDYVSIHVPRTPATTRLVGEAQLALMKPTAYLINTSRGTVVDEPALVRSLEDGRIAGAGLDVFETEPPAADNPLFALESVVLTPHWAGYTEEAWDRCREDACDAVERLRRGEWPRYVVNQVLRPRASLPPT